MLASGGGLEDWVQSRRVDSHLLLRGTSKARKSRDREMGREQAWGRVEGR